MKLFKIENSGLRFVAGMIAMLAIFAMVLSVLWAVGCGVISLDEKFLNWGAATYISAFGNIPGRIVLGSMLLSIGLVAIYLGHNFILDSRALGNRLFNNSTQIPK